MITSLKRVAI